MVWPARLALGLWLAGRAGLAGTAGLAGPVAYVTNQSDQTLSVVDIDSGAQVAVVAIPGAPAGVALAPDGTVWVTSPEAGAVSAYDPVTGGLTKGALGGGPLGLAGNPVSGAVYAADWHGDRICVVVDGAVKAEWPTGDSPSGVAVTPDGALVLTADRDSHQVSIFAADGTRRAVVPVGERPFGVSVDGEGRLAYTANVGSNDVSVIDIARAEVVATIPVGNRPYEVALAAGKGFVTNSYGDSVTVFDVSSHAVLAEIEVGEYPEGIDASRDGARVYVANWMSDTLSVLDTDSLKVLAEIDVGSGPRAFGQFLSE